MIFSSARFPRYPFLPLLALTLVLCLPPGTLCASWSGYAEAHCVVFDYPSGREIGDDANNPVETLAEGAGANVAKDGSNGHCDAQATLTVHPADPTIPTLNTETIKLGAAARTTNANPVDAEGGPPYADATVSWSDELRLANADVIDYTALGDVYFYFQPTVTGSIKGIGPTVGFGTQVDDDSKNVQASDQGDYKETLKFKVYAGILTPITGLIPSIKLRMTLSMSTNSFEDGADTEADFSHTAKLGTIYLGDADGNPVANSQNLQLVGDSGVRYDVQPLPGLPAQNTPVITSAATATGEVGVAFFYAITATNTPTGYAVDTLPAGLTLDPATGAITGAPSTAGTYPLKVSATNADGTGSATVTLTVSPPIVTVTAAPNPVNVQGGKAPAFVLKIAAPQTTDLRINYVVKGSAKPGVDYVPLKGSVKLKAGKTSKALKIVPTGDLGGAAKKTLKLTLAPGDGYAVGTADAVKAKIVSGQ